MPAPDEGNETEIEKDSAIHALQCYWGERLDEFELIYPVFYAKGYSRNTALMAFMMDELDDALCVAAAARSRGDKPK